MARRSSFISSSSIVSTSDLVKAIRIGIRFEITSLLVRIEKRNLRERDRKRERERERVREREGKGESTC